MLNPNTAERSINLINTAGVALSESQRQQNARTCFFKRIPSSPYEITKAFLYE
jgi:hypothetical protein